MTNPRGVLEIPISAAPLAEPVITFARANDLAQVTPTPFLALSSKRVQENVAKFARGLPRVRLYYAMKSNPDLNLLRSLRDIVEGIDVASYGEVCIAKKAGITPDRLIHTNPVKKPTDIEICAKHGVRWFTFDNIDEIPKLQRFAPKANLLLRVAIKKRNCVIDLSSKFGAQEKDVFPLLYAACSAGLNVRGVAFHVGSQCKTPDSYLPALRVVRRIFDRASSESFAFDTLDIGGGLPISYRSPLPGVSEFCDVLSQGLEKLFPENLRIIAEPGRSISGDAMTLVVRVIGRSLRKNIPWYYIDDGVYGAFSGRLFDKCDYRLIPERSGPLTPCVVAGPSCDATDIVSTDQMLPRLEIGDLLLVPGMGAYTSVSATSFNGFPPPQILVTSDQWDSEQ